MSNDHPKPAEQPPPPPPPPAQPYPASFNGSPYSFYYPTPDHADPNAPNGMPPGAYMMPYPPPHPGLVYYPPPGQPAQGYTSFPQQAPPPAVTRSKRKQVKMACTNCAAACKRCDEARPCERCVKYGLQDSCVDGVRKERKKGIKRGPYKRKNKPGTTDSPPYTGFQTNGDPQWSSEHPPPPTVLPAPPPGFLPPPPPEGYYHHPYYYPPPPGYPHPPPPDGHEGSPNGQPPQPYYMHGYTPMPMYGPPPPGAYIALPGQVPPPVIAASESTEARNGTQPATATTTPNESAATDEPSNTKKKRRTKTGEDGTTKQAKKAKRVNGEARGEGAQPVGAGEGRGRAPATNGTDAHPPPVIAAA